jgi:hypothetical protein
MSGAYFYHGPLLAGLFLLAGCSGRGPSVPTAVSGKVSYHGKLLGTGSIVFVPDEVRGTAGDPICAAIQPDGVYKLPGTEFPAGWYRITVAAVGVRPAAPGQAFGLPYSLLPDKYRDPETSGLSCEVQPARDNAINFNLE